MGLFPSIKHKRTQRKTVDDVRDLRPKSNEKPIVLNTSGVAQSRRNETHNTHVKTTEAQLVGVFAANRAQKASDVFLEIKKQKLCGGEPFPREVADRIEGLFAARISKSGLAQHYASAFPSAHSFTIQLKERTPDDLNFQITWTNARGEMLGFVDRTMRKHEDGSIELHRHGAFVNPKHRGGGMAAKLMLQEMDLLQTLSDHPETRMTLRAGEAQGVKMGPYVWANFGVDFANEHTSKVNRYSRRVRSGKVPEEVRMTDLELQRHVFPKWVDDMVSEGHLPNDPEITDGIKDLINHCDHPWEIANLKIEGLKVPVTIYDQYRSPIGPPRDCDIGKAFLLHEWGPKWDGVFLVNQPDRPGFAVAQEYCDRIIRNADERESASQKQLAEALAGSDPTAQDQAISEIAASGNPDWIVPLQALARRDSSKKAVVEEAIKDLQGRKLRQGLVDGVLDESVDPLTRCAAFRTLTEVDGRLDPHLLTELKDSLKNQGKLGNYASDELDEWTKLHGEQNG